MKGRRRAAEGKLIERRPAVISALEERQTDSEIKVTGKEQFHRGGPSRRWMCNMSGGGGELAGCGGGRAGLFTLRNVSATSTLPLPRRWIVVRHSEKFRRCRRVARTS